MRGFFLVAAMVTAPCFAMPLTYVWTGTVTGMGLNQNVYDGTTEVYGSFTYDPTLPPERPGFTWPSHLQQYEVHVGGQTLFSRYLPGYSGVRYEGNSFSFFDESPVGSWSTGPYPDVAQLSLQFAGSPFGDLMAGPLPVESFVSGRFSFGGGGIYPPDGEPISNAIHGSINSIAVPEPGILAMLLSGLAGIVLTRRRQSRSTSLLVGR